MRLAGPRASFPEARGAGRGTNPYGPRNPDAGLRPAGMRPAGRRRSEPTRAARLAKLRYTCGGGSLPRARSGCHRGGGFLVVKKLLLVALLALGVFAVWRKVQSDRAELDLWTEATTADED